MGLKWKTGWLRWLFPVAGLLALLWYLIRVVPKPSRAAYPCQKVVAPFAWGFLGYLTGLPMTLLAFRKARQNLWRARYVTAMVCLAGAVVGAVLTLQSSSENARAAFTPSEGANHPIGIGRGIYPGRVAWVYAPAATSWDGTDSRFWWSDQCSNQGMVDRMMSQSLRSLTAAPSDAAAWEALFRHFNRTRGSGDVGYRVGEQIAIKINLVNNKVQTNSANLANASPHMIISLLRQLVNQVGVPQTNLVVYDAVRGVPDQIYAKCHAEFPGVTFGDYWGGNGRAKAEWAGNAITYAVANNCGQSLPVWTIKATYLINLGQLKCHNYAGVTLTAKNYFGDLGPGARSESRDHDWIGRSQMGIYNPLVDLVGHKHLGAKTLLFMIDGLYGTELNHDTPPKRYLKEPFNGRWTASLFVSQDPMAIDSVGLDFVRNEYPSMISGCTTTPDNYLHEGALAPNSPSGIRYTPNLPYGDSQPLSSLGVHEHWNDATHRQYSRNLGLAQGIELVSVFLSLDPAKPPGSNFDLTHWKLTLPEPNAPEISSAQLVAGYTNASWFYTGPDGAMVFWCPVTGGTTANSSYPRSELRELLDGQSNGVNWTGYGTHTLKAQCEVNQIPSTGKVIIGQIHSYTGNAYPLVKLTYNAGAIYALVKDSPNSSSETRFDFPNVALNSTINYEIKVVDGLVTMTVNGTTQTVNVFQSDPEWKNQTFYYKAGSYCQDNSGPSTEGARVSFYQLTVSHPTSGTEAPAITSQPLSQSVSNGGTANFTVTATGTSPLSYQWRKDGVALAGMTNNTLAIAKVGTIDAGNYTVVITNAVGSVTSAVASLTLLADPIVPLVLTCAPAKTVECGTAWSFDTPRAKDDYVFDTLVFDDSVNDLRVRFNSGADEVGDEIILEGVARDVSSFIFEYYGTNTTQSGFAGAVQARVRFYRNDGPPSSGYATPGTVLYDSGPFGVPATARATVAITDFETDAVVPLTAAVPDSFTWTVQFSGLESGDEAGVDLYSPPVVGQDFPDYWQRTAAGWELKINTVPMDFAARLMATHGRIVVAAVNTVTNIQPGGTYIATRTWRATDPFGNSNTCAQAVTVVTAMTLSDVAIAGIDSPTVVPVGSNLTQTILVVNNGPSSATGLLLTNKLPSGVNFVSLSSNQGSCSNQAGTIFCNLGVLPNGGSATVTLVTTASKAATITSLFTVTANEPDPEPTKNACTSTSIFTTSPQISSFSPTTGPAGTTVTLTGKNFDGAATVRFNGIETWFSVVSSNSIKATAPLKATTGPITVTSPVGTATSSTPFTVTAASLSSQLIFVPNNAPVGASVSIIGPTNATAVRFNTSASVTRYTRLSANTLQVNVPADAVTGPIVVTAPAGVFVSTNQFVLLPAITGFSPASASVAGTKVTLSGSGFTGATAVKFNGVNAGFTVSSSTSIQANLPASAMSGPITVVTPAGVVASSNSFSVLPGIRSFSPTNGLPDTQVLIFGNGLGGTTNVLFNGLPASFAVLNVDALVAMVPAGASSGRIQVRSPAGTATSGSDFMVLPIFISYSPTNGVAGTTVLINGSAFLGTTKVEFNGLSAKFTVLSNQALQAVAPSNVMTGPLRVTTPAGTATNAIPFVVLPRITNFSPTKEAGNAKVVITGSGFTGATNVMFSGTNTAFTLKSDSSIEAIVPTNIVNGPIRVATLAGVAQSTNVFTVLPKIDSFAPIAASWGASVTIYGSGFNGATNVQFNQVKASFVVVSLNAIQATVPTNATSGTLRVITPAGTATNAALFKVLPMIASFTPTNGPVGTVVTVVGTSLGDVTNVLFGAVKGTFTLGSSVSLKATVPAAATNGPISVRSPSGLGTSTDGFTVVPVLLRFTPTNGSSGTAVTLAGTGFSGVTNVQFNGTLASFQVNSPTQILTTVPNSATTGPIQLWTSGTNVTSTNVFVVTGGVLKALGPRTMTSAAGGSKSVENQEKNQALTANLSILRQANGAIALTIAGPPGHESMIEVSLDLVEWRPLHAVTNAIGHIQCVDEEWPHFSQRFYRVITK